MSTGKNNRILWLTILLSMAFIMGVTWGAWGGGMPEPGAVPGAWIGPDIKGHITLRPAHKADWVKANFRGKCDGANVKITRLFPLLKPFDQLTEADIKTLGLNFVLDLENLCQIPPKCLPTQSNAGLAVRNLANIALDKPGKKIKMEATLSFFQSTSEPE
jgi:hypothetical protein